MTKPIFVDTGFFLAILNPRDKYHQAAKAASANLLRKLITSEAVLLEIGDGLAKLSYRHVASAFLHSVRLDSELEIVPMSSALLADAIDLFSKRADKEWGLTDCTSFVIMQQRGIQDVLATDRHFDQAGFVRLL